MKSFRFLRALLATLVVVSTSSLAVGADADPSQITISVGRLMEQGHYSRHKLDNEISVRLLHLYLENLDYGHLVFTQQDLDAFAAKYGDALDDDILLGNPTPAYEIFDLYKKRVQERVAKVKQWLAQDKFKFKSDRTVMVNRQKAAWPKDEAEADQLWHDRLESELLALKLAKKPLESPIKVVTRRYDQFLHSVQEQTNRDAVDQFLSALAQTYDPHSEYMSKDEYQNFLVQMKLSLVGIGAVLKKSDDGYTKIMELVVGGPAEKEGHLKVGDRITAVAQGDKPFVEVIDMKLDKVVSMIRGKKGTTVHLLVIPSHASDPSVRKKIAIVREEVKIKDQEAKAYIIDKPDANGGASQRIGWITLPGFYGDTDGPNPKSTTDDVSKLLQRLKKENISALVIDIRRNGGGYLAEATRLTGLFIKKGPVVQVKDANGKIDVLNADEPSVTYDGPLIVLTSRLSASASEIFAGALQDYGRAVIVGDQHTFGKGTVQQLLPVDRFVQFLSGSGGEAGALKLTIQKFYRVAGGSTQFRGVNSDVVLPSLWDRDDIGESALKGPLPYDEVPSASFSKSLHQPLFLDELRNRSTTRVTANPEFKYINDDIAQLKETLDGNKVSLNEQTRRNEIAKQKTLREKRIAERNKRSKPTDLKVYAVTLDNVDNAGLELAKNDGTKKNIEQWVAQDPATKHKETASAQDGAKKDGKVASKKSAEPAQPAEDADENEDDPEALDSANTPVVDPIRAETLNIAADLIELRKMHNVQNTASTVQ